MACLSWTQIEPFYSELVAMTMEFVAPMHLHEAGFCSAGQSAQLRVMRLERALTWWLPACAQIDSFQHWAYDNPGEAMITDQCDRQWADLSRRYFPWISWGDDAGIGAGEWRHVSYMFTNPFYFIEYALANFGAIQISAAYERDRHAAITRYRSAMRLGATATVPELFRLAGATFTFDADSLRASVETIMNTLQ
jgi:oligoendopeptidase F